MRVLVTIAASVLLISGCAGTALSSKLSGPSESVEIEVTGGHMQSFLIDSPPHGTYAYAFEFLALDTKTEWEPAAWIVLNSATSPLQYQFMVYADSQDQTIWPQLRILDSKQQKEISTTNFPSLRFAQSALTEVTIRVDGQRVTAYVNGQEVDHRLLPADMTELKLGFSSGRFRVRGDKRILPPTDG
jgi:hypothetical protein